MIKYKFNLLVICFLFIFFDCFAQDAITAQEIQNAINQFDFKEWMNYANGLKNCTPGTYKVINPVKVMGFSMISTLPPNKLASISHTELNQEIEKAYTNIQILGWSGNKCNIIVNNYDPVGNPTKIYCSYSQDILQKAINTAEKIGKQNPQSIDIQISSSDFDDVTCKQVP